MSKYVIQRREVGWRKFRIVQDATNLFGKSCVLHQTTCFTQEGAERWIARRTWARVNAASDVTVQIVHGAVRAEDIQKALTRLNRAQGKGSAA